MTALNVRVGEVAEQIRGVTYGKNDATDAAQNGYLPILRAGNITDTGTAFDDLVYVPEHCISPKQFLRSGDVLIAASSGSLDVVGKTTSILSDYEGAFGAFCKVLRPNQLRVDARYFANFFKTAEYRRTVSRLAAGANINNLRNEHLDDLLIPLPSLPEQRRIAAILDKADALRAKRREALAQLDRLAQSIFVEMFGDPTENPLNWACKPLGSVVRTASGGTPDRSHQAYYGGTIPWVKSGELHRRMIRETEEHITQAGLESSSAKLMPPGTVLVAMYGATVGAVSQLAISAATNQAICCMQPSPEVSASYLIAFLEHYKPSLLKRRVGGAQPNLSQDSLRSIPLPIPSLEAQVEFERRIDAIHKLEEIHLQSSGEMENLLGSLQHRAFLGQL